MKLIRLILVYYLSLFIIFAINFENPFFLISSKIANDAFNSAKKNNLNLFFVKQGKSYKSDIKPNLFLLKRNCLLVQQKKENEFVFVKYNSSAQRMKMSDTAQLRELIILNAQEMLGTKYKYGSSDSTGLDCSSFIELSYLKTGIWIPRMAHNQAGIGKEVSFEKARKGDLIFYGQNIDSTIKITHVGMVYSNSTKVGFSTIHCVSSGVLINKGNSGVWKNYWNSKVLFCRSIF